MTDHLLIDGQLVPGAGPYFDVIDPATGKKHTALAASDEAQLTAATTAAANLELGAQAVVVQRGVRT